MNLSKNVVKLQMLLLLETNSVTTTLEVKGSLRDLGYTATQDEVSKLMTEIGNEMSDEIEIEYTGQYKIYKLKDKTASKSNTNTRFLDYDDDDIFDDDIFDDDDDDDDDDDIFDDDDMEDDSDIEIVAKGLFDDFLGLAKDSVNSFNQSVKSENKPNQLGMYFKLEHAFRSSEVLSDNETWIVKLKDGVIANPAILTFSSDLTSDKVRSRYATIMKVKIQDVRAKRAKSYNF